MTIFDAILLISLSGFVFYGLFFGLIRVIGSIFGIIIGAFVASHFYLTFFNLIHGVFFGLDNLGKVIAFFIVFGLAFRLTVFGFALLDKAFNIISIIPFLKTFNRIGGALLGFVEGSLFIGLVLFVLSKYTLINYFLGKWIIGSRLAPFFISFTNVLKPFLSQGLTLLKSLI